MAGVNWRSTSRLAARRSVSDCCRSGSTAAVLTQNGVKMKPDPDLVAGEVLIVVTFTWCCGVSSVRRSAEDSGDVQVHEPSKSKSEQGSSKNEPLRC